MIDRYFRPGEISVSVAERLAAIEHLPPAQIDRASRVVRALATPTIESRDRELERIVGTSLRALGHRKALPVAELPEHYNPVFLNTDRDLAALTDGLRRAPGARLCLYGPPGTGKTAFAHHLGRTLDQPVVVKRGSDLISKWVGETEELIAEAFRQAHESGSILLIDEADSFLRDRGTAQRSWEVTQVNELLTQMGSFAGVFIASTNLVDALDSASLRRFDFKIRFDFLSREQRRKLLRSVCDDSGALGKDIEAAIDRIDYVTPGDFANVLRQMRVTGEAPSAVRIVELLKTEVAMKPGLNRRSIGFVR
jgi:SpoVK/Ycf46/Vps4 family AAA+-type ATPase